MRTLDTFVSQYLIYVCALIGVVVWLRLPRERKWGLAVTTVIAGIIALALMKLGSSLYVDQRPFVTRHVAPWFPHPADNGFPSDHTLVSMLIAGCVFFYSRRWGAVLAALSLWIGLARVEALVHRPIDIVGAVAIALFSATLGHLIARAALRRWPAVSALGFPRSGAATRELERVPAGEASSAAATEASLLAMASQPADDRRELELAAGSHSLSQQTAGRAEWNWRTLDGVAVALVVVAVALWVLELAGDVI